MKRRDLFKSVGLGVVGTAAGWGGLYSNAEGEEVKSRVNTNSQPSSLKITDMRIVKIRNWNIIRLDTNQDICGYGEVRDGASATYALMLKSRILGENPCNVDKIFRKLKQFGFHARQAGGPVSIEEACWDLAGKAWGVPCWQMLGGKFRDKIRVYADTRSNSDPEIMGKGLLERRKRGITFLKMDFSISLLKDMDNGLSYPKGQGADPFRQWGDGYALIPHPFVGVRITDQGLKKIHDYVYQIREIVGWDVPIAADHFGHFYVEDAIKLAQILDPLNLAWLEDMIPWQYTDQYIRLKSSCTTPILTGEDIYLKEGFLPLFEKKAISICHPDIATSGGLLETKKIGDLAMEHGIGMALHMAGSPVTLFSSVHCAAATENFLVMEHHNVDDEWYDNLIDGVEKPLIDKEGFVKVPDGPGLGIELNEEAVKKMLKNPEKEYFPPTEEWNNESSWDRLWSFSKSQFQKSKT